MLQMAAYLLAKDAELHFLLDGRRFSRRYQRERVIEFCLQVGTTWATLECVCAEQTALGLLAEAVAQHTHPAANRTPELHHQVPEASELIDQPKLVIDTDASLDSRVDRALRYLTDGTIRVRYDSHVTATTSSTGVKSALSGHTQISSPSFLHTTGFPVRSRMADFGAPLPLIAATLR